MILTKDQITNNLIIRRSILKEASQIRKVNFDWQEIFQRENKFLLIDWQLRIDTLTGTVYIA